MTKTAMIMLEGLSDSYISKNNTPVLYDLSNSGIRKTIKPLFAFRGIEATIFSGYDPIEHNVWTEYNLIKENLKKLKNNELTYNKGKNMLFDLITNFPNDSAQRILRYSIKKYIYKDDLQSLNLIPLRFLSLFESSLKTPIYYDRALIDYRTIFDILRNNNKQFTYFEPKLFFNGGVLNNFEKEIRRNKSNDFFYVKLCDHDILGHQYGPKYNKLKDQLIKIDKIFSKIIRIFQRYHENISFIILSAHGMSQINKTINILSLLEKIDLKPIKDYILFLDSTMARFWFNNDDSKYIIMSLLQNLNVGHFLSIQEKNQLKISKDKKYGEEIFVVDEGVLIHPCYFHVHNQPKGMHGYAHNISPESYAPFIVCNYEGVKSSDKLDYSDLFSILSSMIFD